MQSSPFWFDADMYRQTISICWFTFYIILSMAGNNRHRHTGPVPCICCGTTMQSSPFWFDADMYLDGLQATKAHKDADAQDIFHEIAVALLRSHFSAPCWRWTSACAAPCSSLSDPTLSCCTRTRRPSSWARKQLTWLFHPASTNCLRMQLTWLFHPASTICPFVVGSSSPESSIQLAPSAFPPPLRCWHLF